MTHKGPEWIFLTPRPYYTAHDWLLRDLGALSEGMNGLGIPSRFYLLEGTENPISPSIHCARWEQLVDHNWWRGTGARQVFALTSARPLYEPVVHAIKAAGLRLYIRMDSEGYQSPRQGFWRYVRYGRTVAADAGARFPVLTSLTKALVFRFIKPLSDDRWLRQFSQAEAICIESPLAAQRLQNYFSIVGRPDLAARVKVLPSPIGEDCTMLKNVEKEKLVVAVGRWQHLQKGASLLIPSLERFLRKQPEWKALLLGPGEAILSRLLHKIPQAVRARITLQGRISRIEIPSIFLRASMILNTSEYEGMPNSLSEAVCCGCSVVGPTSIASLHYFTSHSSGTLFPKRHPGSVAEALFEEARAWKAGHRSPQAISQHFSAQLHPRAAAAALLRMDPSSAKTILLPLS